MCTQPRMTGECWVGSDPEGGTTGHTADRSGTLLGQGQYWDWQVRGLQCSVLNGEVPIGWAYLGMVLRGACSWAWQVLLHH